MKSNITLLALNGELKNEIANSLAKKLEMFVVNVNDIIKYDLINVNQVVSIAGLDYYNKVESKTVKSISSYDNALITLDLDTFFNNDNYKFLKETSLFIYIRINFEDYKTLIDLNKAKEKKYENILKKRTFAEKDKILKSLSDIVIDVKINDKFTDIIIKQIKDYYKEVL